MYSNFPFCCHNFQKLKMKRRSRQATCADTEPCKKPKISFKSVNYFLDYFDTKIETMEQLHESLKLNVKTAMEKKNSWSLFELLLEFPDFDFNIQIVENLSEYQRVLCISPFSFACFTKKDCSCLKLHTSYASMILHGYVDVRDAKRPEQSIKRLLSRKGLKFPCSILAWLINEKSPWCFEFMESPYGDFKTPIRSDGKTILMHAANFNKLDLVKHIVSCDQTELKRRTKDGRNALLYASMCEKNVDTFDYLISETSGVELEELIKWKLRYNVHNFFPVRTQIWKCLYHLLPGVGYTVMQFYGRD